MEEDSAMIEKLSKSLEQNRDELSSRIAALQDEIAEKDRKLAALYDGTDPSGDRVVSKRLIEAIRHWMSISPGESSREEEEEANARLSGACLEEGLG